MIGLTRAVRVFAYGVPVDLRKGFNGLSAFVEQEMKHKLLDGDVYLFGNDRAEMRHGDHETRGPRTVQVPAGAKGFRSPRSRSPRSIPARSARSSTPISEAIGSMSAASTSRTVW